MRQPTKNVVIEIESSPDPPSPPIHPRSVHTHSSSKPPAVGHASAKGKGKARATARPTKATGPVIELTDSEDDIVLSQSQPPPGSSNPKALRANPSGTSTSQENILPATPASTAKKRKLPLFLQSQSDEENEPPMFGLDPASSLAGPSIGGSAKRVNRGEKGKEDKGKRKAIAAESAVTGDAPEEAAGTDMDDWDMDFWNKPFPFMLDGSGLAEETRPAAAPPAPASAPAPEPAVAPVLPAMPAAVPLPQPAVPHVPQALAQPPQPEPVAQPPPVAEAAPEPAPPPTLADLASQAVAQVLEIVPDVEPTHLLELVRPEVEAYGVQGCVERVVGALFEQAGGYPKVEKRKPGQVAGGSKEDGGVADSAKGKERKREEEPGEAAGREAKRTKVDYASVDRLFEGGVGYFEAALAQLQADFPRIPKRYLRHQLQVHRSLYAPAHLGIAADERNVVLTGGVRPYVVKATAFKAPKGKARAIVDEAFERERSWLMAHLDGREVEEDGGDGGPEVEALHEKGKGKEKAIEDEGPPLEEGEGIECQCCFSEYRFDKMVQCPEAHLFCSDCVCQYAATKLGEHDANIICMHSSGCAQPFPTSELRRVLTEKLMSLYERVKQQKEIEAAGIEGLEECPFCEWKCVMEASKEEEKLFRCGNEDGGCGVVSCRECKKPDHLPKSCKEVEEDKHLDGRHAIEEAMTRALMRNCPKCNKAFVKEAGCNKMMCPNCHTLSCYVCRKVINGYDHFNQNAPGAASTSQTNRKCLLWDQVEERHAIEVKAAAEKALADWKRDHPDVNVENVKVDLPVPPPRPAAAVGIAGVALPAAYGLGMNYPIANVQAGMYPGGAMPAVPLHHVAVPPVVAAPPVVGPRRGRRRQGAAAAAQEANRQYQQQLQEAERRQQQNELMEQQRRQQLRLFEAGQRAIQHAQEVANANARLHQQLLAEQNRLRLETERQQQEQRQQEQAQDQARMWEYQRLLDMARAEEQRKAANEAKREKDRLYADAMRRYQEDRERQLQGVAQHHGFFQPQAQPEATADVNAGMGVGRAEVATMPAATASVRTRALAQVNAGVAQPFQEAALARTRAAAAVAAPAPAPNPFLAAPPTAPPARARTTRRQIHH